MQTLSDDADVAAVGAIGYTTDQTVTENEGEREKDTTKLTADYRRHHHRHHHHQQR